MKITEENATLNVDENALEQEAEELVDGEAISQELEEEEIVPNTSEKSKLHSDEEVEKIVNRRIGRKLSKVEEKHAKELEPYREVEYVLNNVLGTNNISDATKKLKEFYQEEGINVPQYIPSNNLTEEQIKTLANAKAQLIIESGYDEMLEEANDLARKGGEKLENLTKEEKIVFQTLAERLTKDKEEKELKSLGVDNSVVDTDEFKKFRNKFKSDTPIKEIYELYSKDEPKKEFKPLGSMKDTVQPQSEKEILTPKDIVNLTDEEWDKPGMWEKVREIQKKWKN